jgi:hypothetical protein
MSAQRIGGGNWPTVKEVLDLFVAMGCEIRTTAEPMFSSSDSGEAVRYLYNPDAKVFVVIDDLVDTSVMTPSEIQYYERRLDLEIPKKPDWKFD